MGALGLLSLLTLSGTVSVAIYVVGIAMVEGLVPANWITVAEYFGRNRFASIIGVMAASNSVLAATAPVLSGWAFDQTQSYRLVLIVGTLVLALGGIMFALADKPAWPRPQPQVSLLDSSR